MDDRESTAVGPRTHFVRLALAALCLLLTFEALSNLARWRANRDELLGILSAVEIDNGNVRRVAFERTPLHAKLIVARALVYDVLTRGTSDSDTVAAGARQLPEARQLALAVLREQPQNWQARMLLGAATYLEWSLTSDRRLYTAAAEWEQPLTKALREAGGKPEPRRFLLGAYLETWAALSPEKKSFARELLRQAFHDDQRAFRQLAPTWLKVADDREMAFATMPDRPAAWQFLERRYAATGDWVAFRATRQRYLKALESKLGADLVEAEERLRLGDLFRSRSICLGVIVAAPVEGRFAGLVTRALQIYPPGLHGLRSTAKLKEWLDWVLELHAIEIYPFPPRVLNRLVDAIGELEAAVGAYAALAGADIYRTERYEKLARNKINKAWAPFLIAKARWLVARGELALAAESLEQAQRSAHSWVPYWLAKQRLARATNDLVDLGTADQRLAEMRSRQWQALAWRWRGHRAILELYPAGAASGLSIEIVEAPASGAVVSVLWDGTSVAFGPVAAGGTLELEIPIESGIHLLEVRSEAGGEVFPGRVRLVAPARRRETEPPPSR